MPVCQFLIRLACGGVSALVSPSVVFLGKTRNLFACDTVLCCRLDVRLGALLVLQRILSFLCLAFLHSDLVQFGANRGNSFLGNIFIGQSMALVRRNFGISIDIFGRIGYTIRRNSIHTRSRFGRSNQGFGIGWLRNVLFFFYDPCSFESERFPLLGENCNSGGFSCDLFFEDQGENAAFFVLFGSYFVGICNGFNDILEIIRRDRFLIAHSLGIGVAVFLHHVAQVVTVEGDTLIKSVQTSCLVDLRRSFAGNLADKHGFALVRLVGNGILEKFQYIVIRTGGNIVLSGFDALPFFVGICADAVRERSALGFDLGGGRFSSLVLPRQFQSVVALILRRQIGKEFFVCTE